MEPWVRWCCSCSGELRFGSHRVESTAGVQQGDPLGPLLFSLTLLELLDKIGEINGISLSTWYLDDGIFIGKKASILQEFSRLGPDLGFHLNLSKCEIFWPPGDQTFIDFPPEISRVLTTQGWVELLGSPIFGLEGFMDNSVKSKVNKVLSMQSHLSDIDDAQIELHLLRSCLSLCKINYLLRTIPPDLITTSYNLFDSGLHQSLESIIHSSLDDTSMLQASLPISFGGLGLRRASSSAPAAYIGSLNSSKDLVLHLLRGDRDIGNDDVSVSDSSLREELQSLYPNVDIKLAPQKSLQYAIDTESLVNLKASVPLRDKARLNTIGTPETGSWFWAIPNPNLGLTRSRQEFPLSLSMWLGRHIFPHPIRCICGQTIDNYGDHVLEC